MLTYKIEKPTGFIPYIIGQVKGALHPPSLSSTVKRRMDKIAYSKWIEDVKDEFKIGDLVTVKGTSVVKDTLPFYYVVTFIDEMCHNVAYDYVTWEPMCISVKTEAGFHINKTPSSLRLLTIGEIQLVNLSNSQPKGSA